MTNLPTSEYGIKLAEFKHWIIYLHPNQCYLGRCYLWATRSDAFDFMEMTDEEWAEFRKIGQSLKQAISKLFAPDMFNYAALGNVGRHLHVHFIPRYETTRSFQNITFVDERWGNNYAPYDKNFDIAAEVLQSIAKKIILLL